jgi:hypothetical protein
MRSSGGRERRKYTPAEVSPLKRFTYCRSYVRWGERTRSVQVRILTAWSVVVGPEFKPPQGGTTLSLLRHQTSKEVPRKVFSFAGTFFGIFSVMDNIILIAVVAFLALVGVAYWKAPVIRRYFDLRR